MRLIEGAGLFRGVLLCALTLIWFPSPSSAQNQTHETTADSLRQAQALLALHRWHEAALRLTNAVSNQPSSPDLRYLLAYALLRDDKPLDSLKAYTEAAHLRAPSADDLVGVASDYVLLRDYPDAEHWLSEAVRIDAHSAYAWYLLGRTQYKLDHPADAVRAFEQNLLLSPENVRAEYNLGLAYERMRKPEEAIKAYNTAIRWDALSKRQDAQPYLCLGMLELSQGNAQEALSPMLRAAQLAPKNPLIQQELGKTYASLQQDEKAISALQQAVLLAPGAEVPHFFLGRVYRKVGRTADAEEQFSIAKHLLGTHSEAETPNPDQTQN